MGGGWLPKSGDCGKPVMAEEILPVTGNTQSGKKEPQFEQFPVTGRISSAITGNCTSDHV